jgi:AAA+ ATPase superfamily predicted ATPase
MNAIDQTNESISVKKLKNKLLREKLPFLKRKNREKNPASYSIFVRFSSPDLRGGWAHQKVVRVFGKYFSPRVEPVLFALPGTDVSETPKGRFVADIKSASFIVDIESNKEISFTYPVHMGAQLEVGVM